MVEVQDVRDVLTSLSDQRVPDTTVEKMIRLANTIVENERSGEVPQNTMEDARLVVAAYLTLDAYANKLERTTGRIPPMVESQLTRWNERKKLFLQYVKRGSLSLQALIESPDTLWDQYEDGDLESDLY